jgi:hypothetical protein
MPGSFERAKPLESGCSHLAVGVKWIINDVYFNAWHRVITKLGAKGRKKATFFKSKKSYAGVFKVCL